MGFFKWFFNLFKSNLDITRIAVQEATIAAVKKRPAIKPVLIDACDKSMAAITNKAITTADMLPYLFRSNIDLSKLPPEQKVIIGPAIVSLVDQVAAEMQAYIEKKNIAMPTEQLNTAYTVMQWVKQAGEIV